METGLLVALLSLIVAFIGGIAAVAVVIPSRRGSRPAEVEANIAVFKERYILAQDEQFRANENAYSLAPSEWKNSPIPVLTDAGWAFSRPLSIDQVRLSLREGMGDINSPRGPQLKGLSLAGPISYSRAVIELAGKSHFTNGLIYRPVNVDVDEGSLRIAFEKARYFQHLDTGEALGWFRANGIKQRFRERKLKDPFDLTNRVASLGILTVTIYEDADGVFKFVMHKRTSKVALASNSYHVVPAGEFTPSDIGLEAVKADFSIRRNIQREYAEEILGHDDAQGDGGVRIKYATASPYRELTEAEEAGDLSLSVLGLGLDPLTWKPELLTAAIFRRGSFEQIFGEEDPGNFEGKIIRDNLFCQETIESYTTSTEIRFGARACLQLAWQHRETLLRES